MIQARKAVYKVEVQLGSARTPLVGEVFLREGLRAIGFEVFAIGRPRVSVNYNSVSPTRRPDGSSCMDIWATITATMPVSARPEPI